MEQFVPPEQKRRKDLFEKVALQTIYLLDREQGTFAWKPDTTSRLTELILAAADEFAKGKE